MPNVISCIFGWNELDRAAAGLLGAGQRLAKDLNGKHCVLLVGTATAPLLDELDFIDDRRNWGYKMRFGLFEVPEADMRRIAQAMAADTRMLYFS